MWWWWHALQHWLAVHTGSSNTSGAPPNYNFWSGAGSDLSEFALVGALLGLLRKHNCEVRRCWRLGRHRTAAGHAVCRKHSPAGAPAHRDVLNAHHAATRERNRGGGNEQEG